MISFRYDLGTVVREARTESYTLDSLNRITGMTYPQGDTASYTYDAAGNRLTKTTTAGGTTTYTYDDADQLLSDGTSSYSYDPNGNLLAAGSSVYTWDYANRLSTAHVGSTTASYSYDGDGTRTSKTANGTQTSYVWDRQADLPLLASDGTDGYLPDTQGSVLGQLDAGNSPTYYLDDALGSVRGTSGTAGTLLGSADFDVFGAARATSGQQPGAGLGFTGNQTDAETGFSYLRARDYSPALGRFVSADSVVPNGPGTQGFNPYAYVENNPTTWLDPTGSSLDVVAIEELGGWGAFEAACTETLWCIALIAVLYGIYWAHTKNATPMTLALAFLGLQIGTSYVAVACLLNVTYGPGDSNHCFNAPGQTSTTRQLEPSTSPDTGEPDKRIPLPPLSPGRDDGCKSIGYWDKSNKGGADPGDRSWQFQEKVTGQSPQLGFYLYHDPNHTEFDGCKDGVPLEAKGCNYAFFFSQPWWWPSNSGSQGLQGQATRQNTGAAVESLYVFRPVFVDWQFAETAAQGAAAGYFASWHLSLLRTTTPPGNADPSEWRRPSTARTSGRWTNGHSDRLPARASR